MHPLKVLLKVGGIIPLVTGKDMARFEAGDGTADSGVHSAEDRSVLVEKIWT
jgi:hypothetical protein